MRSESLFYFKNKPAFNQSNTLADCFATLLVNIDGCGIRERLGPGFQPDNSTGYNKTQVGRIFLDIALWVIIVERTIGSLK
jgi:hypothetical protein